MLSSVASPTLSFYEHYLDLTVQKMYYLIDRYWSDVCPYRVSSLLEAFLFVRNLPYVKDVDAPECQAREECVKRPKWTIEYGGDCDDKAVLMGAFLRCLRIPFRIVTVALAQEGEFDHTYLEAYVHGQWLPVDATYEKNILFREHPYKTKKVW